MHFSILFCLFLNTLRDFLVDKAACFSMILWLHAFRMHFVRSRVVLQMNVSVICISYSAEVSQNVLSRRNSCNGVFVV